MDQGFKGRGRVRDRGRDKDKGSEVDQEDQVDQYWGRGAHHHISTGGIRGVIGEIRIDPDLGVCLDLTVEGEVVMVVEEWGREGRKLDLNSVGKRALERDSICTYGSANLRAR